MSGKWNDHDSRNVILEALECYTYFSTWSTCFQAFRYWNDLENTFGICFLHNQSSGIRGKPSFSVVKSGAPGLFSNLYATSGNSTQLGAMWRCSNKPHFLADLLEGLSAARKNDGSNPSPFFWVGISSKSIRSTPHPVTVTTRIIAFLVGNPYKPSFATVTGWGVDPTNRHQNVDNLEIMNGLVGLNDSFCILYGISTHRGPPGEGVHWESENTINTRCFDACHHYVFVLNM